MTTSFSRKSYFFSIQTIVFFVCLIFCFHQSVHAQEFIGQMDSRYFSKQEYGAGTQNWAIREDHYGRVYFANNEGVLSYDGGSWKVFNLPNKTIVRSIEFSEDGRLYVGGQDELGYFEPDNTGQLAFTSLVPLMDATNRQFADIWNIVVSGKDVFFRSTSKLFYLRDKKITTFLPSTSWEFLGVDNHRIIVQDKIQGFYEFRNGKLEKMVDIILPSDFKITAIAKLENGSIIATEKNGLFTLHGNHLSNFTFKDKRIDHHQFFTSIQSLPNNELLIGTYENGIYHVDSTRTILEIFSKGNGLQNNDVKCIFRDQQENIWVGLDNGISFLSWGNPIRKINPNLFNNAAGYSCTIFESKIYFALANGIYSLPIKPVYDLSRTENSLKKIADGLTWKIVVVNGHLLAGRDNGFYEIKNDVLVPINRSTGYWIFQLLPSPSSLSIITGSYLGISVYRNGNSSLWNPVDYINLNTSCRFLAYDSLLNAIWISHPYRGIYKVSLPEKKVSLYTHKNGLPSDLDNHVFKIRDQVLVATVKGVFVYDSVSNQFKLSSFYDKIFNGISLRYLQTDKKGNLWFVHEKKLGVYDIQKNKIILIPELNGKILSGFEYILPVDSANIFVGGEAGFFHINFAKYHRNTNVPQVYIRKATVAVKSKIDSVLLGGFKSAAKPVELSVPKLKHDWNSFYFEFSSSASEHSSNIEYNYQLKGFDEDWSGWSKKQDKEYTNIPPGHYVFQVKAKNNLGKESAIRSYPFIIVPPWYLRKVAVVAYFIITLATLYALAKWRERKINYQQELKIAKQKRKFEKEQRKLEQLHQAQLEKSEKELIQLRNEKLESEIEYKNSELAATTMNLVQKKEFLIKLKEELKLYSTENETAYTEELKKIIRSLSSEEKLDKEWEQFSIHFNSVHSNFLITLKNKFPNLNAHDLKLCAYLRMNLTSKEMSRLMSISVRGVEISRYRLRKKLQVPAKEDLFQFLLNVES